VRLPWPTIRAALTLALPERVEAASAARNAVTALNGSLYLVSQARLADAQLPVSELVANAIRHGTGSPVGLTVRATPQTMRVEVRDHGRGFDPSALPGPSTDRAGGWGLRFVAALARRWGTETTGQTAIVWFESDRPQRETGLPITTTPPTT
jgi:anti-sigma regulatory factor (Ser/Thr protein kinase)